MATSTVTLPYEANYTAHRTELQRRDQTKRWLAERERHLQHVEAPPLVPGSDRRRGERAGRRETVGRR